MNKALYKGLIASGQDLGSYGTVFLTVSDNYKSKALLLAKRFKNLGFDFVCTSNTAKFLQENDIDVRTVKRVSEDKDMLTNLVKHGEIKYVLNIGIESSIQAIKDGQYIRSLSAKYNIYTLTSIDTMNALVTVLEERHENVSEI
jgi:carbamoyl-phosphate synthase large subunit